MMKILSYAISIIAMLHLLAVPGTAIAAGELQEFRGTSVPLAIFPTYKLEVLPVGFGGLESALGVMPEGFQQETALRINPGDSEKTFVVFIAKGSVAGNDGAILSTFVAIISSDGLVYPLQVNTERGNGNLERLCIFPSDSEESSGIVFLVAFSEGANSVVSGYSLGEDNQLWNVDCGGAKTLYGWFSVSDLDSDGTFELLTTRSMDGVPGGFSYSAIRRLIPDELRFVAAPDDFRSHFVTELEWVNWVVETQSRIQTNPDSYINSADQGPFFIASYEGNRFGFDSIVELPVPEGNYHHLEQFNTERRSSFTKVIRYQEQLAGWLAGGSYPVVWNLNR